MAPISVGHLTPQEVVELRAVLLARGIPAANPLSAAASSGKSDSKKAAAAQAKLAAARQAALAAGEDLDVDAVIAQIAEFNGSTVLTDPREKGNPIVWASAGFMRLTGYAKFQLLGKNCKFLQGRDTSCVFSCVHFDLPAMNPVSKELMTKS